jgi:hypothetical protein
MYLVELKRGQEEVYRSMDELTAAIRRGDVTWQSRIYHQAAMMWISITLHPHFTKIVGDRRAEPPQRLPRAEWTFLRAEEPPARLTSELEREKTGEGAQGNTAAANGTTKTGRSWRRMFGGLIGQAQT